MKYLIVLFLLGMANSAFAMTAEEVAKISYNKISGFKSSESVTTLKIINAQNQIVTKQFNSKTIELKDGKKNLIILEYPIDIKGTKLLTYERLNTEDSQWIYLPELNRTKRIANSKRSTAFMGSEFTYEDIINSHYKKYTYQKVFEKTMFHGREHYMITRFPIDRSSGYKKQVLYIDKKSFLISKIDYFNNKSILYKIATISNYHLIKNIYFAGKVHMINQLNKKQSILVTSQQVFFAGLYEAEFNKREL